MSPSPSTSVAKTDRARLASVEITCSVKVGMIGAPLFSYHAILLPHSNAQRTSMSPSPSTSVAKTDFAPLVRSFRITHEVKPGGVPPVFSYQRRKPFPVNAERTSVSPSPSTSAAKTELAPEAAVEITRSVKVGGVSPSLSYHAILLSPHDAERTSIFPSPFTSVAKTEVATKAVVEITCSVKGTSPPRAGSAPARVAANPASGVNTAANDTAVILLCFTIPPRLTMISQLPPPKPSF